MTIHSLTLKNFKKHRDTHVEFGPRLTAIVGPNAAGKTTLQKGVLFALFGARAVGVAANIPTWDEEGDTLAVLRCELPQHGEVRIERTLKNCKILQGDKLLANGVTPCTRLIEEAYGMSSQHLQMLLASRQGESQALLAMGATALQKTVEILARSEVLDKVLDLLSTDVTQYQGQMDGMGAPIDVAALQQECQQRQQALAALDAEAESKGRECIQQQCVANDLQSAWVEANKTHEKRAALLADVARYKEQSEARAQEIRDTESRLAMFQPNLEDLWKQSERVVQDLLQEIASLRERGRVAAQLDQDILRTKEAVTLWDARAQASAKVAPFLEEGRSHIPVLSAEVDRTRDAKLALEKEHVEAQKAVDSGVCRACNRPFSPDEWAAAKERLASLQPRLGPVQEAYGLAVDALNAALEDLKSLERQYIPNAAEELARQQETLEALLQRRRSTGQWQDELASAEGRLPEAREMHADLGRQVWSRNEAVATLNKARELAEDAANRLQVAHEELEKLPVVMRLDDQERAWKEAEALAKELQQKHLVLHQQINQEKYVLRTLEERLEIGMSAAAKRAELGAKLDKAKRLQSWLRKSRSELLSELWDGLLSYASHLLSTTTDGVLSKVYREDDALWVVENGRPVPVSEQSGFQRSLLGLSLRISLSRVFFGERHVLLLDECTSDANEESAARVAGLLQSLASQVVFISHREGDAVNADHVITLA